MRKIVQVCTTDTRGFGLFLVVLCNDNTLWQLEIATNRWRILQNIPQPKEAMSKNPSKIDIDKE